MELIEGSETSAIRNQTPRNYRKENILHIDIAIIGTPFWSGNLSWSSFSLPDIAVFLPLSTRCQVSTPLFICRHTRHRNMTFTFLVSMGGFSLNNAWIKVPCSTLICTCTKQTHQTNVSKFLPLHKQTFMKNAPSRQPSTRRSKFQNHTMVWKWWILVQVLNLLTPDVNYSGRTAPLTNLGTEYFKHGVYSPFLSIQNAVCFIILTYLVSVLFTFYIQDELKLKKNSGAKRLSESLALVPEVGSTKTLMGVSMRNHSVEHRRSWEPNGYSDSQEITHLLWNTNVTSVLTTACLWILQQEESIAQSHVLLNNILISSFLCSV